MSVNGSGLNVLVAEDNATNYFLLEVILKRNGMNVTRVGTGEEAVEVCLDDNSINLVLMDLKMPGIGGLEASRRIKKARPELPIIAQTAYAMSGDQEKALEAGCDGYIPKPIRRETLLDMIQNLISKPQNPEGDE